MGSTLSAEPIRCRNCGGWVAIGQECVTCFILREQGLPRQMPRKEQSMSEGKNKTTDVYARKGKD